MKSTQEIKTLIKEICSKDDALMVDHDLNVSILDDELSERLRTLVKNMTFIELNRVVGYFIEELEGDGIEMSYSDMDDPNAYLSFCINDCDQTEYDLQDFVNVFKEKNIN